MLLTAAYDSLHKDSHKAEQYLKKSWERLNAQSSLFTKKRFHLNRTSGVFAYYLEIGALNPAWLALVLIVPNLIFSGPTWLYFLATLFLALGFFWTKYFLWLYLTASLRRLGYKGKLKVLSEADFIKQSDIWNGSD
jgi:hypothetical protein